MQAKLKHLVASIKEKNPSLIKHVCKKVQDKRGPANFMIDQKSIAASKKSGPRSNRSRTSGRSRLSRKSAASSLK